MSFENIIKFINVKLRISASIDHTGESVTLWKNILHIVQWLEILDKDDEDSYIQLFPHTVLKNFSKKLKKSDEKLEKKSSKKSKKKSKDIKTFSKMKLDTR